MDREDHKSVLEHRDVPPVESGEEPDNALVAGESDSPALDPVSESVQQEGEVPAEEREENQRGFFPAEIQKLLAPSVTEIGVKQSISLAKMARGQREQSACNILLNGAIVTLLREKSTFRKNRETKERFFRRYLNRSVSAANRDARAFRTFKDDLTELDNYEPSVALILAKYRKRAERERIHNLARGDAERATQDAVEDVIAEETRIKANGAGGKQLIDFTKDSDPVHLREGSQYQVSSETIYLELSQPDLEQRDIRLVEQLLRRLMKPKPERTS